MNLDSINKKENVLVACLSKLSNRPKKSDENDPGPRKTEYSFVCGNGEAVAFTGYMTNEAPVKAVIEDLAQKGERLDRIVVICSDDVRKVDKPQNDVVKELFNSFSCEEMSTLDYYRHMVEQYVQSDRLKALYEKPIEFKPVPISNNPEETEISTTIVQVAKYIKEGLILEKDYFGKTDLYFDYLGGQRYIASMLYAIATLLSFGESVNIQKVLTMNFENREPDGSVAVKDMKSIFKTGDFAAAIKEVITYGRVKGLNEYFGQADNNINNIIKHLDEFLQHLQLCHTNVIMEKRGEIKKELEKVSESKESHNAQVHGILFAYVVKDILNQYEPLLSGDLPDMLEWCVKHDFMQQALTFCADLLPDYLVTDGLLAPTEAEQAEYNALLEHYISSKENGGRTNDSLEQVFKFMTTDSTDIMKHYNWFTEYLVPSYFVTKQLQENSDCLKKAVPDCGDTQKVLFSIVAPLTTKGKNGKKRPMYKPEQILWHIKENTGRVKTNTNTERLNSILCSYKDLKEQRDISNHAGTKNVAAWRYQTLKKKTTELCTLLKSDSE